MSGSAAGQVGHVKVLKGMPRMDEAEELLRRVHSLCKPIQRKHGWYLPELVEFFPDNPNLLGMNRNRGQTIFIRLRPHYDKNSFLPLEESLVGTFLHELTHNVHGPHDKNFYELLDKLQDEYDALRAGGYSGEGFLSDGKRLGVSHNLPPSQAKAKAVEQAERRRKIAKIMGPPGGQTLGGSKAARAGKSQRELLAEAAERRARDAKTCGHGDAIASGNIEKEMDKAEEESTEVTGRGNLSTAGCRIMKEGPSENQQDQTVSSTAASSSKNANLASGSDSDSDIEFISGPSASKEGVGTTTKSGGGRGQITSKNPQPKPSTRGEKRAASASLAKTYSADSTPASMFWTCAVCTYENDKPLALACEVCESPRAIVGSTSVSTHPRSDHGNRKTSTDAGWICHNCTGLTLHDFWTCQFCGAMKLSS